MKHNILPFTFNVARAFEIAACGSHTIAVKPDVGVDGTSPSYEDIEFVVTEYSPLVEHWQISSNIIKIPRIRVYMCKPTPEEILSCFTGSNKYETIEDIKERIAKYKSKENKEFNTTLKGGALAILKTSIEKLNLSFIQVKNLLAVSETIAKMDGEDQYGAQHIAEAIQYVKKY